MTLLATRTSGIMMRQAVVSFGRYGHRRQHVNPAKAGIHLGSLQKLAAGGMDSRFRGNDSGYAGNIGADDIPAAQPHLAHNGGNV
jgi:hypothetical protein